jgi:serine/threonine protein phosphatase PrpC
MMRIGLFIRRISRAIKFDRESMGQTSSRGHRQHMEDVCVVIPELNELDSFFAVYDGRNGTLAAECTINRLYH